MPLPDHTQYKSENSPLPDKTKKCEGEGFTTNHTFVITGFNGASHAVEIMDAISQAPSLPVNIYLEEIDKSGNYESIFP